MEQKKEKKEYCKPTVEVVEVNLGDGLLESKKVDFWIDC